MENLPTESSHESKRNRPQRGFAHVVYAFWLRCHRALYYRFPCDSVRCLCMSFVSISFWISATNVGFSRPTGRLVFLWNSARACLAGVFSGSRHRWPTQYSTIVLERDTSRISRQLWAFIILMGIASQILNETRALLQRCLLIWNMDTLYSGWGENHLATLILSSGMVDST